MLRLRGFTLIEVVVVMAILAILASMIIPKVMGRPDQAKELKAKQDILVIESALMLYKLDNGFYPSTEQGLQALVIAPTTEPVPLTWKEGGYLKEIPRDPWNHPYHYVFPGKHNEINVFSEGSIGKKMIISNESSQTVTQ